MLHTFSIFKRKESEHALQDGFSLIELMIALVIIGLLMAVVGPAYMGYKKRAELRATKANLRAFKQGIMAFNADTNTYPESLRDLVKKPMNEVIAKKWVGPYIERKEIPVDPWQNKYVYELTPDGNNNPYELFSYGPGGKGTPRAETISVWDED